MKIRALSYTASIALIASGLAGCNSTQNQAPEAAQTTSVAPVKPPAVAPPVNTSVPPSNAPNFGTFLPPLSPPELKDEGGAPGRVQLRFVAKKGASRIARVGIAYEVVGQEKQGAFQVDASSKITNVSATEFTTTATYSNFVSHRDDLGIAPSLKADFQKTNISWIYMPTGKLVAQRGTTDLVSYNFPTSPIAPGAKWKGFQAKAKGNEPVTFTLERIIKHRGRTLAVVRQDHQLPSSDGSVYWFDTATGDFYLSWSTMTMERTGFQIKMRSLTQTLA